MLGITEDVMYSDMKVDGPVKVTTLPIVSHTLCILTAGKQNFTHNATFPHQL